MSQSQNEQKQQVVAPTLGGPFTINLLNRILAFATDSGKDAICTYSLVCKQWREAEHFYCHEMWKNISLHHYGERVRSQRWSHYSYIKRAKSLLASKIAGDAGFLNEIENCGHAQAQEDPRDSGKTVLRFRCPLLARNLRLLPDSESIITTSSDSSASQPRPVMFCDVCQNKVYPFATAAEAKKFVPSDGVTRCVMIGKKSMNELRQYTDSREALMKEKDPETLDSMNVFNLAIVTSEMEITDPSQLPPFGVPPSQPEGDAYHGLAEQFLLSLYQSYLRDTHHPNADAKTKAGEYIYDADVPFFLSKELLLANHNGLGQIRARIVRVPPAPADLDEETAKGKYAKLHPALPDNALGKNTMPTVNGWNAIVVVTHEAMRWFEPKLMPKATPANALSAAGQCWQVIPYEGDDDFVQNVRKDKHFIDFGCWMALESYLECGDREELRKKQDGLTEEWNAAKKSIDRSLSGLKWRLDDVIRQFFCPEDEWMGEDEYIPDEDEN